jgi:hypothetical protein
VLLAGNFLVQPVIPLSAAHRRAGGDRWTLDIVFSKDLVQFGTGRRVFPAPRGHPAHRSAHAAGTISSEARI